MTNTTILILAAGASVRMRGLDKLTYPVDGQPQLRRAALSALEAGCRVIVALPQDSAYRQQALEGLGIQAVIVPECAEGIAASIRAGARVAAEESSLMILPGDMPENDAADLQTLMAAHHNAPNAISRGSTLDRHGHPVLIPYDLVPDLQHLFGDEGARGLIRRHPKRLRLVPLPGHHATLDLDTPEDWAAWTTRSKASLAAHDKPLSETTAFLPVSNEHPAMSDPLQTSLRCPKETVLAVITCVIGASYRRLGTMMALFADGSSAGNLTNGCIEGDLSVHAGECLKTGRAKQLRYGAGSPFFDIQLPCGGGLDIALFPRPNRTVLAEISQRRAKRDFFALRFDQAGNLGVVNSEPTGWQGGTFIVDMPPMVRFAIFGEGPEAAVLTRLVHAAGYPHNLITPSPATFEMVQTSGCTTEVYTGRDIATRFLIDRRTAIVTFFHDHDRELPILQAALESAAFYVGALGSRRVAQERRGQLLARGLDVGLLNKLHAPIGLIPSAHDPQTLAVSVLAEIIKMSAT